MTLPPTPQPKQWYSCFPGDTEKDGDFSLWNGHSPTYELPFFFSLIYPANNIHYGRFAIQLHQLLHLRTSVFTTCSSFLLYFPRCRNKYFFKFGNRILVAHACYIIAHDTFRRFAALCNKSSVIVRQCFYIIHIISIQFRNQLVCPLLLHFLQVDSDKDCQT